MIHMIYVEQLGFVYLMCANNRVYHGLLVCLHITLHHYHHYVNVSKGTELLNDRRVNSVKYVSKDW